MYKGFRLRLKTRWCWNATVRSYPYIYVLFRNVYRCLRLAFLWFCYYVSIIVHVNLRFYYSDRSLKKGRHLGWFFYPHGLFLGHNNCRRLDLLRFLLGAGFILFNRWIFNALFFMELRLQLFFFILNNFLNCYFCLIIQWKGSWLFRNLFNLFIIYQIHLHWYKIEFPYSLARWLLRSNS